MIALPAGFGCRASGPATLIAPEGLLDRLVAAGLDEPATWRGHLATATLPTSASGRGTTAVVAVPGGEGGRLRLKQMRRGGLAGPLWRERFPGLRRLVDNLRVPLIAADRGVPTPRPLGLLTLEGPPGLFRAWIAFANIEGAVDLLARLRSDHPPDDDVLRAAMAVVRCMHDSGIEHVDLNLGNLLVRTSGDAGAEAFVIDLDRGRVRDGGVVEARRLAALRRLERSYRKNFPEREPPTWCYRLYAPDDPARGERYLTASRATRPTRKKS